MHMKRYKKYAIGILLRKIMDIIETAWCLTPRHLNVPHGLLQLPISPCPQVLFDSGYCLKIRSRTRSKLLSWTMLAWGNVNQRQETSTLTRSMFHWNIPQTKKYLRFFSLLRFPFHQTFPKNMGANFPGHVFKLKPQAMRLPDSGTHFVENPGELVAKKITWLAGESS